MEKLKTLMVHYPLIALKMNINHVFTIICPLNSRDLKYLEGRLVFWKQEELRIFREGLNFSQPCLINYWLDDMFPKRMIYFLISFIIIFQVTVFVAWLVHFQLKNEKLIVKNIVNVQNLQIETINEITQTTIDASNRLKLNTTNELQVLNIYDLPNKIKESFGRGLQINIVIGDEQHGNSASLSFNHQELPIPPKIQDGLRLNRSFDKYVFVYSDYTEQMSMSMLSVLSLCGQAQFGGRKVVRPFVQKSRFVHREAGSLGILFDLNHLDYLLDQAGYSPLIDKQEYRTECKWTDPNHVTIHFLYIGSVTKKWNKAHLKITDEFYDSIFEKTKVAGWTECSFLDVNMGLAPSTKQFCINPTIITDWKILERDIIGGAKCLNIYLWRGIGGGKYRSYFTENDLKFPHNAIQFSLKPSAPIQNEVDRFRKKFLPDRFIAVYVRAELVLIPHEYNINFLKNCIDVIVKVVNALRATSGISKVYVASDMSKYGSGSLVKYVGQKLDHNPFPDIFTSLVSRVGGVVYNYNASTSEIKDRGAIALVDLTLLKQAQYLVTAGQENMSSFLRWVIGTFLANHRDSKEVWSKISVCGK